MSTPIYEAVVDAEEIAPMLGCSTKTVLRLAKAGEIPAVQIGKLWRFRKSAIDAWLSAKLAKQLTYKVDCTSHPRVPQSEGKN
jgi:excisionase family DNA binding protein